MMDRHDFHEDLMSIQASLHDMDRWCLHAVHKDGFSLDRINDFLHRLRHIERLVAKHEKQ